MWGRRGGGGWRGWREGVDGLPIRQYKYFIFYATLGEKGGTERSRSFLFFFSLQVPHSRPRRAGDKITLTRRPEQKRRKVGESGLGGGWGKGGRVVHFYPAKESVEREEESCVCVHVCVRVWGGGAEGCGGVVYLLWESAAFKAAEM